MCMSPGPGQKQAMREGTASAFNVAGKHNSILTFPGLTLGWSKDTTCSCIHGKLFGGTATDTSA